MEDLPPLLRAKYQQLLAAIDTTTGRPISESLGPPCLGLSSNPAGGQRFNFVHGDLSSFDHTGRFPTVCIYGPIYQFYRNLGADESPFGRPLTDVVDLQDGSRCAIFEGGHIHQWNEKAEPFPAEHCIAPFKPQAPTAPFGNGPGGLPPLFHQKWVQLSAQRESASNQTIVEQLGLPCLKLNNNEAGGQRFNFLHGELVGVDRNTPPCVVYGPIYDLWNRLGNVDSGWGRPIADEQDLEDGGRCSVFEGGHIHKYGDSVKPIAAEQCTARYKPTARFPSFNKMPPHFQHKWTQLSLQNHPLDGQSLVEHFGAPCLFLESNPNNMGGQHFNFLNGHLVSLSSAGPLSAGHGGLTGHGSPPPEGAPYGAPPNSTGYRNTTGYDGMKQMPLELTPPFAVYGAINAYWQNEQGGFEGKYGRPICDEQSLPDGGRCSIFEGGHIHSYNETCQGVHANQCKAVLQPPPPPVRGSQPSYQLPPSQPIYHPPPSQPSYHPPPSQPSYQPPPSRPSYQPPPSQPSYKPPHSQPNYQPPPSQPSYQSPPMNYQQPPPPQQHDPNTGDVLFPTPSFSEPYSHEWKVAW